MKYTEAYNIKEDTWIAMLIKMSEVYSINVKQGLDIVYFYKADEIQRLDGYRKAVLRATRECSAWSGKEACIVDLGNGQKEIRVRAI